MVDLTSLLEDEDVRRRFGSATFGRAEDYVRQGRVLDCRHEIDTEGDLELSGKIAGSGDTVYSAHVSVGLQGDGIWVFGRCTCPVRDGCKHVVALLLVTRARQEERHLAEGGR